MDHTAGWKRTRTLGRLYVHNYTMHGLGLHLPGWPVYALYWLFSGHPDGAHSCHVILQWGCDSCPRRVVLLWRSRCKRCEREAKP